MQNLQKYDNTRANILYHATCRLLHVCPRPADGLNRTAHRSDIISCSSMACGGRMQIKEEKLCTARAARSYAWYEHGVRDRVVNCRKKKKKHQKYRKKNLQKKKNVYVKVLNEAAMGCGSRSRDRGRGWMGPTKNTCLVRETRVNNVHTYIYILAKGSPKCVETLHVGSRRPDNTRPMHNNTRYPLI